MNLTTKKFSTWYFQWWRPVVLVVAIGVLAYVLFFHNLTHLTPGYSPREVAAYNSSNGFKPILDNPLGAPYKLVVYAAMKLGHHDLLITRLAAASFAVAASLLFFAIARAWFSYRAAFLVTILFATSSGFLHVARFGSALILQMSILLLVAAGIWWNSRKHSTVISLVLLVVLATMLYVPGMVWFELLALFFSRKKLLSDLHQVSWKLRLAGIGLFLVILAPLIRACVLHSSTLLSFAGLPASFGSFSQTLDTIGGSLLSVAIHSNGSPDLWVGHVPLLNVIEIALFLLGTYVYLRREIWERSLFLLGAIVLSLVLIGLGGPVSISSLVPLLYLVIGAGLYELLQQWLHVFPRNPFARFAGIFLICALVLASALYQYRAYFVAWPHNAATKQTFTIQRL